MVEVEKQMDSANKVKPKSDAIYLLFLLPVFVVLGFLDFYPIAWTINISLTNFSEAHFFTYSYVGLTNFYNVLTSPTLTTVIMNNIVFAGSSILLMAGLGFGVALLITQPGIRGKTVFRSLILVPWAFPAFITILIWKNLLDQHFGAVNQVLSLLFHVSPNWTGSVPLAMISVILVNLWLSLAYYTFVYTASLQSIPQELYDAAQMDGYGTLSRVRNIVIPLLSRQIAFITIFGFIFAWSNFYIPYLLTSGEPGISTQILITYSYTEAFSYLSYGVAAVYSIISVLILLVMVIIVNHYSKMMSILY
jgi:arabinogalactan oligomer/maltooligosaccharide transport system permease protein